MKEHISAVELILEYLKQEGVTHIFGIPGGPVTPLFDALYRDRSIELVTTRHECGAAMMAAGYARVSGRLGVCCATTGPGSTNLITGLAAAKADSLPVLAITAQVATLAFGKGSLQDSTYDRMDIVSMLKETTKLSAMVVNAHNLATTLRQALRWAMSGRRGPVHLNIPTDLMKKAVVAEVLFPGFYRSAERCFDREGVRQAADLLLGARRPAILAGHGVNLAAAQAELAELARILSIPVATTPKGKGAFDEGEPLSLGVFGIASSPRAERYLLSGDVDVLLVLGSSMHEISTQGWEARLQPKDALIQQDIDASVVGRNYPVSLGLIGDMKTTLRELIFELKRRIGKVEDARRNGVDDILAWKRQVPSVLDEAAAVSDAVPIKPQRLMRELNDCLPEDAIIFADSGNNTLWALHYLKVTGKNMFIHNWGEFGAMGYGVAAAIGGKLAAPQRPVIAIVGDGAFGMHGMEVSTAVSCGIPVIWVVLNDGRFNAVHHGQQLQYGGRTMGTEFHRMDIAKIAEGLGAWSVRVLRPQDIGGAIREAIAVGNPAVLDVMIDADEVPPIHARVESLERFFAAVQ